MGLASVRRILPVTGQVTAGCIGGIVEMRLGGPYGGRDFSISNVPTAGVSYRWDALPILRLSVVGTRITL